MVVRVYAPWVSAARLRDIQRARRLLSRGGVPVPSTVPTRDGHWLARHRGRVLEVEAYVPGEPMNLGDELRQGMALLARVHGALAPFRASREGREPAHPNHVSAERALAWTQRGTRWLRRSLNPQHSRVADLAERLAERLAALEKGLVQPSQIVHGDLWDNNVLFADGKPAALLDFDFMGERPRIDDVALTLYYANSTLGREYLDEDRLAWLASLISAYAGSLDQRLSAGELHGLPLALARTVLCLVGMVPDIPSELDRDRHLLSIEPDLEWSLGLAESERLRARLAG